MNLIRKFARYYKPHMKLFVLDMICAFLVSLCDLVYPMIARDIINVYVPGRNLRMLLVWSAVMLGIYAAKMLLNFVVQYWGHIVGLHIQADMRRDLFRHLQKLPFTYFDENKTGSIMSRIVNDLFDISELAHHGPEDIFISTVMLIGAFIMLASINVWLTLILFALVPIMAAYAIHSRKEMLAAFKRSREEVSSINANVETAISGIRVSRSYTAGNHENAKFDAANAKFKAARTSAMKALGKFQSGMGFINDLLYLEALVGGGLFFYFGKIDIGDLAAYILYVTMFLKPINRLVSLFEQLQDGMTGLSRFNDVISIATEREPANPKELTTTSGHIVFDNVSFRYANSDSADIESHVISNLSIDIPAGKTVALVGPSGGGKTTLCNLIPRFYEPTAGHITIDGTDIAEFSSESLRKNIGMVAQDVFLFNGTLRENIAYGNPLATDADIIAAAKKANIHDYIMSLEHGYDSEVGERGLKLSGGQKQRVSIARVFLKNPPILILDEATSALDNATEMLIQESLSALSYGRTCLVVAHRLSTIKNADEIIVLTSAGIAERGTHDDLMALDGIYASLYRYQFHGE